jgi:hypothetical protein
MLPEAKEENSFLQNHGGRKKKTRESCNNTSRSIRKKKKYVEGRSNESCKQRPVEAWHT